MNIIAIKKNLYTYWSSSYGRLTVLLILAFMGTFFLHHTPTSGNELQESIANKIIRFHVLANSDSLEDQQLKMKVRDSIIQDLSPILSETETLEDARVMMVKSFPRMKEVAENTIHANGYQYDVQVSLEPVFFPAKVYGDFTFPAGTYEALRVQIGESKGQNWWCVMFPPLCFVDETYSIVDKDSDYQLKHLLTEDEYSALHDGKVPVRIRFKLFDKLKGLFRSKK